MLRKGSGPPASTTVSNADVSRRQRFGHREGRTGPRACPCDHGRLRAFPCDLAVLARWCAMIQIRDLIAALTLAVGMAGSAVAGPFEDGRAALQRGDYVTAMRLLRPFADQGSAAVQTLFGNMYQNGQGVPQDYAAAASWYRKAADQGFARAQFELGRLCLFGRGVPQDEAQGVKWVRKAADQDFADAQHALGVLYYAGGHGVPQDYAAALNWYRKAADQGNADAQFALGLLYDQGQLRAGFERRPTRAFPAHNSNRDVGTSQAGACRRTKLRE
jgi:Sel1 repeat